jgi:hypothetical protein
MNGTSPDRKPASLAGCLEACRRCETVVDAVVAHDGGNAGAAWRAVSAHLRHCVDHFRLLIEGLAAGRVDYDARQRDARLERDPAAMREALSSIVRSLSEIDAGTLGQQLLVSQSAATGHEAPTTPSCLDRELVFLSGHTIHHIAIMAYAAEAAGASLPPHLAMAFSTQAYRESLSPSS